MVSIKGGRVASDWCGWVSPLTSISFHGPLPADREHECTQVYDYRKNSRSLEEYWPLYDIYNVIKRNKHINKNREINCWAAYHTTITYIWFGWTYSHDKCGFKIITNITIYDYCKHEKHTSLGTFHSKCIGFRKKLYMYAGHSSLKPASYMETSIAYAWMHTSIYVWTIHFLLTVLYKCIGIVKFFVSVMIKMIINKFKIHRTHFNQTIKLICSFHTKYLMSYMTQLLSSCII